MKKIVFYFTLISIFPATTFANGLNDGNHKGPVSEYVKQHITPVISEKRQSFDAVLTSTEKNELTSIREQLQELHQNHKAKMLERSQQAGEVNLTANGDTRKENHAKMKGLMEQVHIIAENHRNQLDEIFTALSPQQKQWKSDISQLLASKNQENGNTTAIAGNSHFHNGIGGRFKTWNRSGFLLLNPADAATFNSAKLATSVNDQQASSDETMSIFPNPAVNVFSLNLSGISPENKLIVTDMTGKIVLEKENVLPSETISCNDLNNGIYFVRLSSTDDSINQKLIVSH